MAGDEQGRPPSGTSRARPGRTEYAAPRLGPASGPVLPPAGKAGAAPRRRPHLPARQDPGGGGQARPRLSLTSEQSPGAPGLAQPCAAAAPARGGRPAGGRSASPRPLPARTALDRLSSRAASLPAPPASAAPLSTAPPCLAAGRHGRARPGGPGGRGRLRCGRGRPPAGPQQGCSRQLLRCGESRCGGPGRDVAGAVGNAGGRALAGPSPEQGGLDGHSQQLGSQESTGM